jgi:hypothetical protein
LAGGTGRLPGQTPLNVTAFDVDYAETVEPDGMPGLKMVVAISGRRYNLFDSRSLVLDATFDDMARKEWKFGSKPKFEEKLPDGNTKLVDDPKINLTTNYDYVSPITFQRFEDGKNYQLTIFFAQYSNDYVKDVRQRNDTKDEKQKAAIVEKYKRLAKDAQTAITARHGIRIALHRD